MAYVVIRCHDQEIGRQNLRTTLLIGRSPECDISVHDHLLSRKHCRLSCIRGRWVAVDLASRNGSFVGSTRIGRHMLRDGERLRLGNTYICFYEGDAPALRPGKNPTSARPADPHEALAGTVFAFELPDSRQPELVMLAGRPTPRPAPLAPPAYEREGVGSMVLEMLSDLHDSVIWEHPRRQQGPKARPRVQAAAMAADPRDLSTAPSSPLVERLASAALVEQPDSDPGGGLAVATVAAPAHPVMRQLGMAATAPATALARPVKRQIVQPRPVANMPRRRPTPVLLPRRKRYSHAALDFWMAGLMAFLLAVVIIATRQLLLQ